MKQEGQKERIKKGRMLKCKNVPRIGHARGVKFFDALYFFQAKYIIK